MLDYLTNITAFATNQEERCHQLKLKLSPIQPIISSLFQIFLHCHQIAIKYPPQKLSKSSTSSKSSPTTSPTSLPSSLQPLFHSKLMLLQLISNLSFNDPNVQDLFGQLGAIPLVMAQTNLDDRSPLIREWAIFALRNLTENHLNNQAIIEAMQIQQVMNTDELREMGLEAWVDPKTGKIRIKSK